jgi:hypothetical protein
MFKNLFVRPGTSAANAQQKQFREVGDINLDLMRSSQPHLLGAIGDIGNNLNSIRAAEPMRQASISSQIANLQRMMGSDYTRGMANRAGMEARDSGMQGYRDIAASMGGNSSMLSGSLLSAINSGVMARNQARAGMNDPMNALQRRAGISQMMQQLYGQMGANPALLQAFGALSGQLGQSGQAVLSQPQVQVGPGLGDFLGQAAGMYAASLGMPRPGGGGGVSAAAPRQAQLSPQQAQYMTGLTGNFSHSLGMPRTG